jgi:hypothetical protein
MMLSRQPRADRKRLIPGAALVLAALFAVVTSLPAAAAIRLASGQTLHAQLTSADINTKNAHVGDQFTMVVVPPYPGGLPNFAGAKIYGHISEVRSGGQGRSAQLKLGFDSLTLASGQMAPISGSVAKLESTNENTTARKGLGAGVGAAVGSQTIGRLLGGALGGVVGIVGGAAGGYLYAKNDKPNFNVATGAQVTIVTTSNAELMHRQAR